MFVGYLIAAPLGWLVAGSVKFAINSLRRGRWAFGDVGYGGFPSTHTTVAVVPAATIGFREGVDHPAFAVALGLVVIVVIDALSLRRKVGEHAAALNRLESDRPKPHRERMGHTPLEVAGGIATGIVVGWLIVSGLGSPLRDSPTEQKTTRVTAVDNRRLPDVRDDRGLAVPTCGRSFSSTPSRAAIPARIRRNDPAADRLFAVRDTDPRRRSRG